MILLVFILLARKLTISDSIFYPAKEWSIDPSLMPVWKRTIPEFAKCMETNQSAGVEMNYLPGSVTIVQSISNGISITIED